MPKVVTPLVAKTYLKLIENAVGAGVWRSFYCLVDGREEEVMRDGDLSCAFFASSVLTLFKLIERVHGTVEGVVKDLEQSGWRKIEAPQAGAVIVWAARADERGESHAHIGFYVDEGLAISNDSQTRSPQKHPWDNRAVEAIYWSDKLEVK